MTYNQAALFCFIFAILLYFWPWIKHGYLTASTRMWVILKYYRESERNRYNDKRRR